MTTISKVMAVLVFAIMISGVAEAKNYSSCGGAYAFYLKDKSTHKAFATTNGDSPNGQLAACGGSTGPTLSAVKSAALTRCAFEAKRHLLKAKCRVISSK